MRSGDRYSCRSRRVDGPPQSPLPRRRTGTSAARTLVASQCCIGRDRVFSSPQAIRAPLARVGSTNRWDAATPICYPIRAVPGPKDPTLAGGARIARGDLRDSPAGRTPAPVAASAAKDRHEYRSSRRSLKCRIATMKAPRRALAPARQIHPYARRVSLLQP